MRASEVVKRQSARIASRLRCCCHAPTSRRRALWSEIQRFKHCRASAPISISAISIQLPATRSSRVAKDLRSVVDLQPFGDAPRFGRFKFLVQRGWVVGVQSLPRTGYRVGFPLDPPAASDAGYAAAFVPARLNPFLHAAPAHPLHRSHGQSGEPDNLFVLYGSTPLPLIAQQQNSGVGLRYTAARPRDTNAFSSCCSSVVNLPGIS